MFCQLLAVSTGRSHVVAWPGRPLGGQSSALAVTESPEVWSRLWGLQVRWGSCGQAQLGRRCCRIQGRSRVLRGYTHRSRRSSWPGPPLPWPLGHSHHARTDPLSLCPGTGLGTPHLPRPSALGMPPPRRTRMKRGDWGGRASPRTVGLTGQSWGVGPGGQLWSLPPPCRLLPWCRARCWVASLLHLWGP